jgi:CheY-like chemotaxis protein
MGAILVIDDDALVREGIRWVLERAGYAVTTAADGLEGCRAYRRTAFDLVITDIVMPEQEGLGTIRRILDDYPAARILAISGAGAAFGSRILDAAGRAGAMETLAKPFRQAELLDMVAECLSRCRAPAPLSPIPHRLQPALRLVGGEDDKCSADR